MPEPTPEAWAQIRHDYEHTDRPLAHICAEHKITVPMLRYRMKKWEWTRRKPLIPHEGPAAVEPAISADTFFHPPPPGEGKEEAPADAASIVPRLRSAVARVLPAIEATVARLASGSQHPREMEQAGRTLSSLTRALRELNALLSQYNARAETPPRDDDPVPEDIDEFRNELARRIEALIAADGPAEAATTASGEQG